MKVQWWTNNMF